jgi:ketosteroid isomerase-like protein
MDADESTNADREAILEVHRRYLEANAILDAEALSHLWSHDPSNVYFNLTGHTYRGFDHWAKLWNYYSTRMRAEVPWRSWDHNLWIHGDMALLTCHRLSQLSWIGEEESPIDDAPMVSRSTEIYVREGDEWRVAHVHYSPAAFTPRPGNV